MASSPALAQESGAQFKSAVSEFASACDRLTKVDRLRSRLSRNGWDRIELAERPLVVDVLSGWQAGQGQNASIRGEITLYRKDFRGRELLLLLNDYDMNAGIYARQTRCQLYDVEQTVVEDELYEVLGHQRARVEHQGSLMRAEPTGLLGVSWHDPFGLRGASRTAVNTYEAKYHGVAFVMYSATRNYLRNQGGPLVAPPPPIQLRSEG